ncbi:hypothetical protein QFZ76_007489 [Streptomyces sp. V4I2]|nr:hypothetical protein [Streptomyces sp. V4I2]
MASVRGLGVTGQCRCDTGVQRGDHRLPFGGIVHQRIGEERLHGPLERRGRAPLGCRSRRWQDLDALGTLQADLGILQSTARFPEGRDTCSNGRKQFLRIRWCGQDSGAVGQQRQQDLGEESGAARRFVGRGPAAPRGTQHGLLMGVVAPPDRQRVRRQRLPEGQGLLEGLAGVHDPIHNCSAKPATASPAYRSSAESRSMPSLSAVDASAQNSRRWPARSRTPCPPHHTQRMSPWFGGSAGRPGWTAGPETATNPGRRVAAVRLTDVGPPAPTPAPVPRTRPRAPATAARPRPAGRAPQGRARTRGSPATACG